MLKLFLQDPADSESNDVLVKKVIKYQKCWRVLSLRVIKTIYSFSVFFHCRNILQHHFYSIWSHN